MDINTKCTCTNMSIGLNMYPCIVSDELHLSVNNEKNALSTNKNGLVIAHKLINSFDFQ